MPGCSISGSVSLGERCLVGTGARILQNLTVGEGSIIGAGAVVTRSFGAGSTLIGVPAVKTHSMWRSLDRPFDSCLFSLAYTWPEMFSMDYG